MSAKGDGRFRFPARRHFSFLFCGGRGGDTSRIKQGTKQLKSIHTYGYADMKIVESHRVQYIYVYIYCCKSMLGCAISPPGRTIIDARLSNKYVYRLPGCCSSSPPPPSPPTSLVDDPGIPSSGCSQLIRPPPRFPSCPCSRSPCLGCVRFRWS